MIIGIGGRKGCGKTTLSYVAEQFGFKKVAFADALKQLLSETVLSTNDITELNKQKESASKYCITSNIIKQWSKMTQVPEANFINVLGENQSYTIRELLQKVGTDCIRAYNPNWHVEKIKAIVSQPGNYVVDDIRFPNEKSMLDELGAINVFVVRPSHIEISNHVSETSIGWRDFDTIIDMSNILEDIYGCWAAFILFHLLNRPSIAHFKAQPILLNKSDYTDFKVEDIAGIQIQNMHSAKAIDKNNNEIILSPLQIEDLKMYPEVFFKT